MYRFAFLFCLLTTGLFAADDSSQPKDTAQLFPGSTIPHVAVGGSWSTDLQIMHSRLLDIAESYTVRFYDQAGQPLSLPVVGQGNVSSISGVLQPRGAIFIELAGGTNTVVGYAVLESPTAGGTVMNAVLTQKIEGRPDFQASVPSTDPLGELFQFPFRNDAQYTTTLAMVSSDAQTVTSIARNGDGLEICRATWAMEAGQHESFLMTDRLTCAADTSGVIEVQMGATGAMIAFLFNDFGAFTTQLPFEITADPAQ